MLRFDIEILPHHIGINIRHSGMVMRCVTEDGCSKRKLYPTLLSLFIGFREISALPTHFSYLFKRIKNGKIQQVHSARCAVLPQQSLDFKRALTAGALKRGGAFIRTGIGVGTQFQQTFNKRRLAIRAGIMQGGISLGFRQGNIHGLPLLYEGQKLM